MFKTVLLAVLVILYPWKTVTLSDCTNDYPITDPEYVGCYEEPGNWPDPFLPYQVPDIEVETANDCIACCVAADASYNFAGITTNDNYVFHCTCGNRQEDYYKGIPSYDDCKECPGNNSQSCGYVSSRISVYKVPQSRLTTPPVPSSVETSASTKLSTSVSMTLPKTDRTGASENKTALIAGSAGGGAAVLLVICVVVAFCIIRKRSSTLKEENNPASSIRMDEVGTNTDSASGRRNPSFQSNSIDVDALYAKPDKKRNKQQQQPNTADPEDPSYQDVLPTGVQHQYAMVQDDSHPYNAVGDETNLYDSIQDDPQYATVQKGRKQGPNVKTNPLYGKGSVDNTVYDPGLPPNDNKRAPSVCEMMDNIIYE